MIEEGQIVLVCENCGGSGQALYSGMGPVDNMDVWVEWDICATCNGLGYEDIMDVEVER